MPNQIVTHEGNEELIGFRWDGARLSEFALFFGGDFFFKNDECCIIIGEDRLNIGDWLIKENDVYEVISEEEFEKEFDMV